MSCPGSDKCTLSLFLEDTEVIGIKHYHAFSVLKWLRKEMIYTHTHPYTYIQPCQVGLSSSVRGRGPPMTELDPTGVFTSCLQSLSPLNMASESLPHARLCRFKPSDCFHREEAKPVLPKRQAPVFPSSSSSVMIRGVETLLRPLGKCQHLHSKPVPSSLES